MRSASQSPTAQSAPSLTQSIRQSSVSSLKSHAAEGTTLQVPRSSKAWSRMDSRINANIKRPKPRQSTKDQIRSRPRGSAWMSPQKLCLKRIRNETCLSRRRVGLVSRFKCNFCGYPEGAASRGRLSWVTFFGEAKKVTGCRAAPG